MNAQTIDYDRLQRQVGAHPYPLVFATISGSEAAWAKKKAELVEAGRWVELLY